MSLPSSPPPLSGLGLVIGGVLSACGVIGAGLFGWLGSRHSTRAPLQQAVNDALRLLMEELQTEHARLSVRILDLEATKRTLISENLQLKGDVRQAKQIAESTVALAHKAGLDVDEKKE